MAIIQFRAKTEQILGNKPNKICVRRKLYAGTIRVTRTPSALGKKGTAPPQGYALESQMQSNKK